MMKSMKFFSFLMSLLMMSYVAAGNLNGPPDDGMAIQLRSMNSTNLSRRSTMPMDIFFAMDMPTMLMDVWLKQAVQPTPTMLSSAD